MSTQTPTDNEIKSFILTALRKNRGSIAEKHICEDLQIKPNALKKQISELEDAGYELQENNGQYQLIHEPDIPYPWKFTGRENNIHYFKEIPSTMDVARKMAENDCTDFTVVIAERQNKGRGRLQRTWHSDEGGLYFTIVLRPNLSPVHSFRINFAASLILAKVIQHMFGLNARVKWPNDILIDQLKLSGMLSEMGVKGGELSYVNIGIGINVNNDPTGKELKSTSLKKLLHSKVDRCKLLSSFLDDLQQLLLGSNLENIIPQWKQYTMTIGQNVKIQTTKKTFEGYVLDVNQNGALLLELKDGTQKEIIYGDCFHE